jgi:two-component system phosphate regulon sensor histidine kinase PhoR
VDLLRFARNGVEEFRQAAAEKGLELVHPAGVEAIIILADQNRLKQVLHNLLENAIRYTEKGRIEVTVAAQDGKARLTVADTGVGIDEKEMPFIFDRFFRSDRARRAYKGGSGLGLSIVRWIVESHKGRIAVESRAGRGTTFRVEFPLIS